MLPFPTSLGWDDHFASAFAALDDPDLRPARVAAVHRGAWALLTDGEPVLGRISGRARHLAVDGEDLPAVGDWVAVDDESTIHAVLDRRGAMRRADPGGASSAQVLAANVDVAFIATSLNQDLNLRRVERFIAMAADAGAAPVVLLTKADLDPSWHARVREVGAVADDVIAISVPDGPGVDAVRERLGETKTAVLLGSSGVGKSTLVNALLGTDRQAVAEIRLRDGRGRHTTRHRELFLLPGGGMIIDTPGLRLPRMADGAGVEEAFAEIDSLAADCRFADCRHDGEPGCAIEAALDDGTLDPDRFAAFRKLGRERAWIESRTDARLASEREERWRAIHRDYRRFHRGRRHR